MEEGSLKHGHVATFDSPGKPESKRQSQESSCNTDTPRARRSIGSGTLPLKRMPFGMVQYITNFFASTNVMQVSTIIRIAHY